MSTSRADVSTGNLNQFSKGIINDVNVWVDVLDPHLNIIFWNHVAESISGYSREEVIGHNKVWDWLYPDIEYRRSIMVRTFALMDSDGELDYLETKVQCKNGDSKYILWNSRSLMNEDGVIYGVITFGYDITDRKRAEEALQKAHSEISALYHVTSVTSASLDLDTILERSLECVLETMKSDMGLIHLWDDSDKKLHLVAHHGMTLDLVKRLEEVNQGKGLTGWVFQNGTPRMTPDLKGDSSTPSSICGDLDNAYLGVPMQAKGEVIGVFGILAKNGRKFEDDEVALLGSIADQVGIAVKNARLYQQAEHLATVEERQRLAQDLHDSVTQSLYSLTLMAEASRRLIGSGNLERAEDYITRLGETALDTLKEMRLLVYNLRPPVLDEGLIVALQQRLGAVERRAGVKAYLIAGDIPDLPAPVEEALYRIAQEALNNFLKHSRASTVTVSIQTFVDQIKMVVEDDGIGFDLESVDYREGMGLVSMNERAKRIGATLSIQTSPNKGTRVSVCVNVG